MYLVLVEYRPEGVEELERRHDLALYQRRRQHCRRRPPPRAQRHLPEPGLEGEASLRAHCTHLVHIHVLRLLANRPSLNRSSYRGIRYSRRIVKKWKNLVASGEMS